MERKAVLLQSNYLPPIAWFSILKQADKVFIECCDNYVKQTYRTRAKIMSSQGILDLGVPVKRTGEKMVMKDVEISYKEEWQRLHLRAIESAYGSSPFWEYYEDDFRPMYESKTEKLIDLHKDLLAVVLSELNIKKEIEYTNSYLTKEETEREGICDFREMFSPKKECEQYLKPYYQVFIEKYGFINDLSIVDLLFNMGNESVLYI